MELTPDEKRVLENTTGWHSRAPLYRNHYCASEGHHSWGALKSLVDRGLMRVQRADSGQYTVFCATAEGIELLKKVSP